MNATNQRCGLTVSPVRFDFLVVGDFAGRFCKSPIDHQRLAEFAQHDVGRFEVAMNDAPAVRVCHGVAHVDQARDEFSLLQIAFVRWRSGIIPTMKSRDRIRQRVPLHEPHGVERLAVLVTTERVNRHDAGLLQLPGAEKVSATVLNLVNS